MKSTWITSEMSNREIATHSLHSPTNNIKMYSFFSFFSMKYSRGRLSNPTRYPYAILNGNALRHRKPALSWRPLRLASVSCRDIMCPNSVLRRSPLPGPTRQRGKLFQFVRGRESTRHNRIADATVVSGPREGSYCRWNVESCATTPWIFLASICNSSER